MYDEYNEMTKRRIEEVGETEKLRNSLNQTLKRNFRKSLTMDKKKCF